MFEFSKFEARGCKTSSNKGFKKNKKDYPSCEEDVYYSAKDVKERSSHRKSKRMDNAIKRKDIDSLIDIEDNDEYF